MKNFALSITALLVLTAGGSWAAYHKALNHGAHGAQHGKKDGHDAHGADQPAHTEPNHGEPAPSHEGQEAPPATH